MEKSVLENLNDKIIFFFIKKIEEKCDISLDDSDFIESCDDVNNTMRLTKSLDYIDYDFIAEIYNLNKEKFSEKNLTSPLNRPTCHEYSFGMYETRIETVNSEYTGTMSSYSEKNLREIIDISNSNGDLYYWDYPETHREYLDGETTDSGFIAKSITKIK